MAGKLTNEAEEHDTKWNIYTSYNIKTLCRGDVLQGFFNLH